MKTSVSGQSRNAMVFSDGQDEGLDHRGGKMCDMEVPRAMASVSRAGKNDGWNAGNEIVPSTHGGKLWVTLSSRTLARGSKGNSAKGISESDAAVNEAEPFRPTSLMRLG